MRQPRRMVPSYFPSLLTAGAITTGISLGIMRCRFTSDGWRGRTGYSVGSQSLRVDANDKLVQKPPARNRFSISPSLLGLVDGRLLLSSFTFMKRWAALAKHHTGWPYKRLSFRDAAAAATSKQRLDAQNHVSPVGHLHLQLCIFYHRCAQETRCLEAGRLTALHR